jgi:hypothetical protein
MIIAVSVQFGVLSQLTLQIKSLSCRDYYDCLSPPSNLISFYFGQPPLERFPLPLLKHVT